MRSFFFCPSALPFSGIVKNLHVITSTAPGVSLDVIFVKNGFETPLSCRLNVLDSCSNNQSFVKIKAGDTFAIKLVKFASTDVPHFSIQASMVLETPSSTQNP